MRITRPNSLAGVRGNKSPSRPDWYVKWLENQGKWVMLKCGCIEDVKVPQCLHLITGKKLHILCPNDSSHGFQTIKKTLKLRDVLKARGILIPEDTDTDGLFPPF